jgi:mono/diheme cytochrome c family protein
VLHCQFSRGGIMKPVYGTAILATFFISFVMTLHSQPQMKYSAAQVKRGKYLVEEVAKCPECHTPRDKNNQLDPQRWLQGAPIWIQPVFKTPGWADEAPSLAGLTSYTDEQATRVLEKGERANGGGTVQPPMHIYRMHHDDVQAIIAYLRSLPNHP